MRRLILRCTECGAALFHLDGDNEPGLNELIAAGGTAPTAADKTLPPVPPPARPPVDAVIATHSPSSGGGHFSPDDGVPLAYGDYVEERGGRGFFYAGPCYACGKAALTRYQPRSGSQGRHRCWKCYTEAGRR